MERTVHNPWTWNEGLGFDQAVEVRHGQRMLFCAGQTAADDDGNPVGDDYVEQFTMAMDNLTTVLAAADMQPSDIVRLNLYVTDIQQHFAALGDVVARVEKDGIRAAGMLSQVSALAWPELLLEIEATAVAG